MNINDLPYEMIAKIIGYLCQNSLERAILACKLWKQIIEESCLWSWDVDLSVSRVGKWTKFSQITKRRFNKFSINTAGCDDIDLMNLFNVLKVHGSNAVRLHLSECCWRFSYFVKILKCLPKLSHLELVRTELLYTADKLEVPMLPKLESIKIVLSSGYRQYQSIIKPSIIPTITPACFNDFFRSQKHLKSLSIHSELGDVEDSVILQILDENMPLQLTHLDLGFCKFESDDSTNLVRFSEMQAPTITSLELRGSFSKPFYKLIFSNLKQLKSVRLAIFSLPKDETFYMQLEPNNCIATLILAETIEFHNTPETLFPTCPRWFKEFVRCVPKVTELCLHARCCLEAISFLSHNLKLVEKLYVRHIIENLNVLQFPRLLSLNIEVLEVDANWIEFVRNNIQIKELEVNQIRKKFNADTIEVIQEFIDSINPLKLDILRIGKRLRLTPIYQSSVKNGRFTRRWNDLEWFVDGKCFGSFARKLDNLRVSIEIWGTYYSRNEGGKCLIDLGREILRNNYYRNSSFY